MRTRTVLALAAAILVAAPASAAARQEAGDEQARRAAAALPEHLWEPGPDPVSPAGPGLPDDGGGVRPVLAVLLLLAAGGAGYALSRFLPAGATAGPGRPSGGGRRRFEPRADDERGADRVVAGAAGRRPADRERRD